MISLIVFPRHWAGTLAAESVPLAEGPILYVRARSVYLLVSFEPWSSCRTSLMDRAYVLREEHHRVSAHAFLPKRRRHVQGHS